MINLFKNTIIITLLGISLLSCDNDKKMSQSEYPAAITSYVQNNYPGQTITSIEKDDGLDEDYEVRLSDGTELNFNKNMQLTDMDAPNGIPNSAIPLKIRQYVNANYPGTKITEWEIDDQEQSIELSDGSELDFDMDGNYMNHDH